MQLILGKLPIYIWIQVHVGYANILEQHRVCRQYQGFFVFFFFNMQRLKFMENGFMIYIKTYIGHIILMTFIDWFGLKWSSVEFAF